MKNYSTEQSGRSMIEMLGVLAIVGVLSVAGIAGYSKAMGKFKVNKLTDQITSISSNVKTMFSGVGRYDGLGDDGGKGVQIAYNLGLLPDDMTKGCATSTGYKNDCVKNAVNGGLELVGDKDQSYASYTLTITGITKDACSTLVASDWGGPTSVRAIGATGTATGNIDMIEGAKLFNDPTVPIAVSAACECVGAPTCKVAISYY